MAQPSPLPAAGGAFIAFGALGGAVIGYILRQPTIGFLVGVSAGIALSVLIWLRGR